MWKAFSSSGLRSTRRAGLPSRSSASARLTRSSVSLASRLLVAALGLLLERVDALLEAVEIGEHQLGLDGLDVGDRIDLALDMGDVVVLEAAHHMRDGVDLADMGEELVAEPLALGGAAHQAGDVDEGQPRRHDLGRFRELRQRVEPRIGHRDLADIRLDGAERIVRRLRRRGRGQRIEERRLADIRQADDAAFETHVNLSRDALFAMADASVVGCPALSRSKKPFACMARCTLFWKLASWPFDQQLGVVGDDVAQRLDPGRSLLAKSEST